MLRGLLLLLAVLATTSSAAQAGTAGPTAASQDVPLLTVAPDPAAGFLPVLRVGPVLRTAELERAARSGVPVRVRIRVELWRDRFFDQLVDSTSWSTVLAFEPLAQQFFVRSMPAVGARRLDSYAGARQAIETEYRPRLRGLPGTGRYYYTATLQIETLSVSDIEELERWLQGELQPAVSGQRSVTGALGQGARRIMLRLLDLPQRRVDARSERFRFG
jgi:hypothetical protein